MSMIPAPPASRTIRPLGRRGRWVTIALYAWCVCEAVRLGSWAWVVVVYGDQLSRPSTSGVVEIAWWTGLSKLASNGLLLATVAAVILFYAWLSRARDNAEAITPVPHALGRTWLVFGWIVPLVSLWYPYQIVQTIWRTSDPARLAGNPAKAPRSGLVVAWWVSYLVFTTALFLAFANDSESPTSGDVTLSLIGGLAGLAAALLATAVVRDISRTQDQFAATPPSQ